MKLYNSLTRQVEEFVPLSRDFVGMYSCGPTVYNYATIGNFRTYVFIDLVYRTLKANGYSVKHVMNITDVGHLTGDNLGDADTGEDRIEKAARFSGKTVWDVAAMYTKVFLDDYQKLNIFAPIVLAKATEHITEQIALVQKLEEKGFTYSTSDGIYFDTAKFPNYGQLSTLDQIKEGARVSVNPEKRNPSDFALWKFSPKDEKRQMEWESPWGVGFPGWHIECSAMSMKYLGDSFDIHIGGEDLRTTHHPNEIAQAEAATGKQFVKYWLHAAFLLVDGGKMSKSLGNVYMVNDILKRGFDPLALRYFYFTAHYRSPLNFSWEALESAQKSLHNLYEAMVKFTVDSYDSEIKTIASQDTIDELWKKFLNVLNDDFNTPQALAVVWDVVKSDIAPVDKREFLMKCDDVLALKLARVMEHASAKRVADIQVNDLFSKRNNARREQHWDDADRLRRDIESLGYTIEDTAQGSKLYPKYK